MTNNYHSYQCHGELCIVNKTGSVSWKLHADDGVQVISAHKDGNTGLSIWLKESYANGDKDVSKATSIYLEAEQIDQLIAHLQKVRAEIAENQTEAD